MGRTIWILLTLLVGGASAEHVHGDIDGNGRVEFADFLILARNFSKTGTPYDTSAVHSGWIVSGGNVYTSLAGNVGIGLPTPGEKLHIGDGNFLIEGGGETAFIMKRDITVEGGPSGPSANPIFKLGRIVQAGDGDPEFRILYDDDSTDEYVVMEFDRKGIVASVKRDVGSHFEGFIKDGVRDENPVFRLNSYPSMRLEMGGGLGNPATDVAIERSNPNTLSVYTNDQERLVIKPDGRVGIGTVVTPQSQLQVNGGVQVANDGDSASAEKVGTLRYRTDGNTSYVEMCMQTGTSTYEWATIKTYSW